MYIDGVKSHGGTDNAILGVCALLEVEDEGDGDDDVGIGDSAHKSDDHFDCLHNGNCYLTAYIMFSADAADIVHGAKFFMRLVPYFGAKRNQVLPIWTTF